MSQEKVDIDKEEQIIEKQIQKEQKRLESPISKLSDPNVKLTPEEPDRPYFSFDLDGVICRPPFGMNQVLGRDLYEDELPANIKLVNGPATTWTRKNYLKMRGLFELAKYFGRKPMPMAREGLIEVSKYRTPLIITGRSFLAHQIIEAWLTRYNMRQYFGGIYPNDTNLRTRKYKLHMLRKMGIEEHADDDGEITYYLAKMGIPRLYLRDWPRNAGLPYPDNVKHIKYLVEIAQDLASLEKTRK
jgi:hypothetical protein